MKTLLLALCLTLPAFLSAEGATSPEDVTSTVQFASLSVKEADLLFTPKAEYVHVIFDAFPYRAKIAALGKGTTLQQVAKELAQKVVFARYPTVKKSKIVIVEYSERDDYGAPVWESVVRLGEYEAKRDGRKVTVSVVKKKKA
jgi:hypothetical protein